MAWALTHYLLHGPLRKKKYIRRFFEEARAGKTQEEATEALFGKIDLEKLDAACHAYLKKL